MLSQLVESSPKRVRRRSSTLVSLIIHSLVLSAAVAAARPVPKQSEPKPVIVWHPQPPALPPECRGCESRPLGRGPRPIGERPPSIPGRITIDVTVGVAETVGPITADLPISRQEWLGPARRRSGEEASLLGSEAVDREVVPLRTNPVPRYPATLRSAGIQGAVTVRFVVDTTGSVIMETVMVDAADHPLFAETVIETLRRSRFKPAERRGRKVRQLVVQPFAFVIRE